MDRELILNNIKNHLGFKKDKDFATFLGINQSVLSNWKKRNTYDIELIHNRCREIDPLFLITGKGKMLLKDRFSECEINNNSDRVPFYNIEILTKNFNKIENNEIEPEYYIYVPEFIGCYAFNFNTDSMEDIINNGAILFAKKITQWKLHLEYGRIYVIITSDGRKYLKYIRKSQENKDNYLLRSYNANYEDFEIPKSAINDIWLVNGWINRK